MPILAKPEEKEGKITKIVVAPKGLGKAPSIHHKEFRFKPKPYKFEYITLNPLYKRENNKCACGRRKCGLTTPTWVKSFPKYHKIIEPYRLPPFFFV